MPAVQIAPNVWWVGAVDSDVRDFHGYKTPFGTTYNAYLVKGEKTALIDTVRHGFADRMIANIAEVADPAKLDYIVSNHVEPDHSGSMPEIMALNPAAPVFTSPNGLKGLKAYYKPGWDFRVVKSGDGLNLGGGYSLSFLLMPMVHWPDSMATYLHERHILFSNDAFGQHIATRERFADEIGAELVFDRAKNYWANIVMPFGQPVQRVLAEASKLGPDVIAPSHGLIWRSEIGKLLEKYTSWAEYRTDPKLAVIAYDTMWGSTGILAERLAVGYRAQGMDVKVMSLRKFDYSEIVAEALEASVICVGSPTLNRGMMPMAAAMLHYMKGLGFRNRKGRAFGSWGWSGESPGLIDAALKEMGFETEEPLKAQYRPE
jgi:flavorubredoxin